MLPLVVSVQTSSSFAVNVVGHLHAEHEAVAPRQEVRRLSLIGAAPGAEAVVRADRDVEFFFPVPVHVAEQEVLRCRRRLLPSPHKPGATFWPLL